MPKRIDISNFPVMARRCSSCPFNEDGDRDLRTAVETRIFEGSQTCHHPRLHDKQETHLCRGARDVQITIMYRLGKIDTPDDAGWADARVRLSV